MDKNKVKLGIAPIGWTNDDMPDLGSENTFQQCVSEMALAGFTGCEVGSKYPTDPEELHKYLDIRGLQVCNQWFSSFLLTQPYEEVEAAFIKHIEFLRAMGAKVVGISEQSYSVQGKLDTPIFGHKHIMDDEEWKVLCDGVNRLGQVAKDRGIALTFHHHMGTVVQTAEETDRLMENTDPEVFSLLFDTGHFSFCDEDAVEVLKRHVNRVKHVHLKDIRYAVQKEAKEKDWCFLDAVRAGVFTVPGDGDFDFKPVFDILEENGYEGYMVVEAEQDPAKANPFEYALKGRKYIAEMTGL